MNPVFEKTIVRIELEGSIPHKDEFAEGVVAHKNIPQRIEHQIPLKLLHGYRVHALPQPHAVGTAAYSYLPKESVFDNDILEIQLAGVVEQIVIDEIFDRVKDSFFLTDWLNKRIVSSEISHHKQYI